MLNSVYEQTYIPDENGNITIDLTNADLYRSDVTLSGNTLYKRAISGEVADKPIYTSVVRTINTLSSDINCNIALSATDIYTSSFFVKDIKGKEYEHIPSSIQSFIQDHEERLFKLDNKGSDLKDASKIEIYINGTNGNDETGTGEITAPLSTIQKAIKLINTYRFTTATQIYLKLSGTFQIFDTPAKSPLLQIYHPDCTGSSKSSIILTSWDDDNTRHDDNDIPIIHFKFNGTTSNSQFCCLNIVGVTLTIRNIKFIKTVSNINQLRRQPILNITKNSDVNLRHNVILSGISYIGIKVNDSSSLTLGSGLDGAGSDERKIHTISLYSDYTLKNHKQLNIVRFLYRNKQ